MIVSQNEIYRLTQRVLEGLGAPYGIDRDGAHAVSWLEARGLNGLGALLGEIGALDGDFQPIGAAEGDRIHAAGASALAHAGALVDFAEALATERPGGVARLCILDLRRPHFLWPPAVRRAHLGHRFAIDWRTDGGPVSLRAWPPGLAAGIAGEGADLRCATDEVRPVVVTVTCAIRGAGHALPENEPVGCVLDAAALGARLDATLAGGIVVADELWQSLSRVAARVLVASSATSRALGAGGGDANA